MSTTHTTAALLAALGLALAAPVAASAEEAVPGATEAQSFSEDKLESFAEAATEVQEIQAQYHPELQAATTEEEQQQTLTRAVDDMIAAVEQAPGISVEEYDAILEAAATDPALAEKLNEHLRQAAAD